MFILRGQSYYVLVVSLCTLAYTSNGNIYELSFHIYDIVLTVNVFKLYDFPLNLDIDICICIHISEKYSMTSRIGLFVCHQSMNIPAKYRGHKTVNNVMICYMYHICVVTVLDTVTTVLLYLYSTTTH